MNLPIRVLKCLVALDVVVLLHQVPVVQSFALQHVLPTLQISRQVLLQTSYKRAYVTSSWKRPLISELLADNAVSSCFTLTTYRQQSPSDGAQFGGHTRPRQLPQLVQIQYGRFQE